MMGRGAAIALALFLVSACGSANITSNSAAGGAAGSDAGVEASVEASAGGGGGGPLGLEAGSDAPANPWADSGPIDAGVFDCQGVCCDGTTHYCHIVSGGAAPVFGTTPEAGLTCSDAGTGTTCVPLPVACAGAPSCACLAAQYGSTCQCASAGGGITVQCFAP